jgi:hypothetical protein
MNCRLMARLMIHFPIVNGAALLKPFNDPTVNGLDSSDWASGALLPGASHDAFNQFANSDIVNPVSLVDLHPGW